MAAKSLSGSKVRLNEFTKEKSNKDQAYNSLIFVAWGGAGGGKDLQEVLVGHWEGRELPRAAGPWQPHPSWQQRRMGSAEDGGRVCPGWVPVED